MLNFCREIYVQEFQLKIGNNVCVVIYGTKSHHCIVIHELRTLDFIR